MRRWTPAVGPVHGRGATPIAPPSARGTAPSSRGPITSTRRWTPAVGRIHWWPPPPSVIGLRPRLRLRIQCSVLLTIQRLVFGILPRRLGPLHISTGGRKG